MTSHSSSAQPPSPRSPEPEVREHVTLTGPLDGALLTGLLATAGGAALTAQAGVDAAGRPRTLLTVAHPDPEVVALTRQNLLRACQERGVRAFVV